MIPKYLLSPIFCLLILLPSALPAQVMIVAHRGASLHAPENTLSSCEKAIEMGANYIEMDVRQTKDGMFILMHDRDLSRTTNGNGKIADLNWEEIKGLDAGSWFGKEEKFKGEKIPTFREVLRSIKGRAMPDVDFKAGDPEALLQILEEEGFLASGKVTLYSRNPEVLKSVLKLTDKILLRPSSPNGRKGLADFQAEFNPSLININWWNFSPKYVQAVHDLGMQAFVNTLFGPFDRKRNMKKALKAGADFIQTDHLEILVPLVKEFEDGQSR